MKRSGRPATKVLLPPDPLLRGAESERTIFAATKRPMTRGALHRMLDAPIAGWVSAVCSWGDSFVLGDHRFVVFSIDVAPRTQVYVQLWSQPLEPVLCEVSSGRWNPPADKWLAGERSSRIETFGFTIGGRAENFLRHFEVRSPSQVRALARTLVDIMYAGFDYRGLQRLKAHVSYQSRATLEPVLSSFTPEDVTKVFEACGYSLESKDDDEDEPVVRLMTRGVTTTVAFGDRVAGEHLFKTAVVSCDLPLSAREASELREFAARLGSDAEIQRSPVEMLLQFDGGVTTDWLSRRVAQWTSMIVGHQGQVRRAPRKQPRRATRDVVH